MKKIPRISETEWEVMKVVWAKTPCSAGEIIEALASTDPTWHPKTIKAFLARLVKKKALGFSKEGRAYLYRPLVRQEECVDAASESFLSRVFGGSLKPMLAHFVERKKLFVEDVKDLNQLLENRHHENYGQVPAIGVAVSSIVAGSGADCAGAGTPMGVWTPLECALAIRDVAPGGVEAGIAVDDSIFTKRIQLDGFSAGVAAFDTARCRG